MDHRTPEQVAADTELEQAIVKHNAVYYPDKADHFLGDWLLICEWAPPQDTGSTGYSTAYPGARMPAHRCYGLLQVAQGMVDEEE